MSKPSSGHAPSIMLAALSARFGTRRRRPLPHLPGPLTAPGYSAGGTATLPTASPDATSSYSARTWKADKRSRRFDFAAGLLVSAAAHLGLVLLTGTPESVIENVQETATAVEVVAFDLPEPEETPVEVAESEPTDTPPVEFAPPMQADLPSFVSVDSFVQPMQAPVPSGLSADLAMLTVPVRSNFGTGANAPTLFDISELDRIPGRIRTGAPTYPQEFRRSRVEGDVVLVVVIDQTGHVTVDRVLESTHPEFTRAAVAAAEQCLYEAPRKGGATVSASYTLRVPFRLEM